MAPTFTENALVRWEQNSTLIPDWSNVIHVTLVLISHCQLVLTYCHDKVDKRDGIECDMPPVHEAAQVDNDEDNDDEIDDTGDKIKAHEDEGDNEDSCQRYAQRI